jgi:hypothetical protein
MDGDPRDDLGPVLAELAAALLARARAANLAAMTRAEGLVAEIGVRNGQLACGRCYGGPGLTATGTGDCTCPARCARPCCLAGDGVLDGGEP